MYNWIKEEAKGTEWEIKTDEKSKRDEMFTLKNDLKNIIKEKSKLQRNH
jgi:hypothetical protein